MTRAPFLLAVLALSCGPAPLASDESELARARQRMVAEQIEARGVKDPLVLDALRKVPRHEFVPKAVAAEAYGDHPLSIGHAQTISQPYIVAFMTEAVRPRRGMKVLEVGTGSGYQAAVLASIGCRVYSIEIVRSLADSARTRLARLGYDVQVRYGDGYLGWPEVAPFDAILLTAAPEAVPAALVQQLKAGGRLVAPVGGEHDVQRLTLVEKDSLGRQKRSELLPVRFVPMRKGLR